MMLRLLERSKTVFIICIALLISACLALPAYLIYQGVKGLITTELTKNAINIAATTASFIETEIIAYKALPSNSDAAAESFDAEYYSILLERFEIIKGETGAANIFTEKRTPGEEQAFILDGSKPQDQGPPMGSMKNMTEEELKTFNEGITTESGIMWDKARGEFITGYAPIIDTEANKPVGIVGVEFTLNYAENITNGMRNIIYGSFVIIMLLTTFVVNSLLNSRRKYYKEDYMTGLYNKRYFETDLKWAVRRAKKAGAKLTLIMLDVDYFKKINDTLGHAAGDMIIKSVAQQIKEQIRNSDFCCRFGGDEFIISLVNTAKEQAYEVAERIRREITNMKLHTVAGESVPISLSIGIAELGSEQNAEKLIECADKAMYVSKNSGKNRTTIFGEDSM